MEREVIEKEDFASMLEESFKKEGKKEVKEGYIVAINEVEDSLLVDIGVKSEGVLRLDEIKDENGQLLFKVGDKIKVLEVGYRNERPILSHKKALKKEKKDEFINKHKDDFEELIIDGIVTKKNRGGYIIEADEIEFFMPKFLSAFSEDADLINKPIKVKITKIDDNGVVVSRRKFINDSKKRVKDLMDNSIENGNIVTGKITRVTSYGIYVDLNGTSGFIHYSEISYKGAINPLKYYNEGEEISAKIIGYSKEKDQISLSIKATMPDPWDEIKSELEVGYVIKVTVSNVEPYGAFVDLGNDTEGFLHISEITWDKNIKDPNDYLTLGQELDVEVIEIDSVNRRLRVSLKSLQPKPVEQFLQTYKEGDILRGVITTLTDFGAFVKLDSIEGLLHNEDASWDKDTKCKDIFKIGDEIDVKIAKIDRDRERISLNRKDFVDSPAKEFAKKHKIGSIVTGKLKDIKDFGIFIVIDDNIDALIRNEDLYPLKKEELSIGDSVDGVLTLIDDRNNKIRVSVRRLQKQKEKEALAKVNGNDRVTLGEMLENKEK